MAGDGDNLAFVARLTEIMNRQHLAEIEVDLERGKHDRLRVRLSRSHTNAADPRTRLGIETTSHLRNELMEPAETHNRSGDESAGTVRSEMVGTAYLKANPKAQTPFVKIGQAVEEGDPILIIEAMKTMNQILSPHSGIVVKILVEDGDPVQFGTALMVIH